MKTFIKLFSNKEGEIERFLKQFYSNLEENSMNNHSLLEWQQSFENPIEMADMIGVFIDNIEDFKINMWVCFDQDILINVTEHNVDDSIRYMSERYPY